MNFAACGRLLPETVRAAARPLGRATNDRSRRQRVNSLGSLPLSSEFSMVTLARETQPRNQFRLLTPGAALTSMYDLTKRKKERARP